MNRAAVDECTGSAARRMASRAVLFGLPPARIGRPNPAAYSGGLLRRSNRAEATGCGNPSGKVDPPPRAVHDAVRQVDQQHNMGRLLRFFEIGKGRTSNSLPDLKVRRLRGKRLSILVISAPELLQAERVFRRIHERGTPCTALCAARRQRLPRAGGAAALFACGVIRVARTHLSKRIESRHDTRRRATGPRFGESLDSARSSGSASCPSRSYCCCSAASDRSSA